MQRHPTSYPRESFLGRINDASWAALTARWTTSTYPARALIISAEDLESRDVFFVLDGVIRATVYTDAGREVSMLNFRRGDIIGQFSAIDDAPRSSDAIAERECIVANISQAEFKSLLKEHADISYQLLKLSVGHLRVLSKRVVEFNAMSADERLRAEILDLVERSAGDRDDVLIERPPTQAELAAIVFSSRESVAREMGRMRDAGVALRIKRALHVPSVEKLRRYISSLEN
ncbi:MAG: Crp/Fnr family transcriptional regulator [Pseudomonadota bacterium]